MTVEQEARAEAEKRYVHSTYQDSFAEGYIAGVSRPASPACEHDWRNRVSGGSLCAKCNEWQDKRVPSPATREAVARVIDPHAFAEHAAYDPRWAREAFARAESAYRTADALLAAFTITEKGAEL